MTAAAWSFQGVASPTERIPRPPPHVPELLCHLHDELVARARWLTGNRNDGWDLFQDTAVRALTHAARGRDEKNRAWLLKIMNNLFIDRCRANQTRTRLLRSALPEVELTVHPQEECPTGKDWERLSPESLGAAIGQLSVEGRRVFTLHSEGLSYLEIARRLNVRVSTVGTRLHRARRALRTMLLATLSQDERGPVDIGA